MRAIKKILITLMSLLILAGVCPTSMADYDDYTAISPEIPVNAVGSFTLYGEAELSSAIGSAVTAEPGALRFSAISFDEPGDYTYYLKAVDSLGSESVFKIVFHITVNASDELVPQVFIYQYGSAEKTDIMNYNIRILKVDSELDNGAVVPLEGAVFDLYRGSDVENGKLKYVDGAAPAPLKKDMSSDSDGLIVLGDLQPGTYWLRETKAPKGYGRRNAMMKLSVGKDGVKLDGTEAVAIDAEGQPIPTAVGLGHRDYRITIENTKGAIMPGTGGVGTTLFYVIGSVLVAAAFVLLVLRKKKN